MTNSDVCYEEHLQMCPTQLLCPAFCPRIRTLLISPHTFLAVTDRKLSLTATGMQDYAMPAKVSLLPRKIRTVSDQRNAREVLTARGKERDLMVSSPSSAQHPAHNTSKQLTNYIRATF